LTDRCSTWAESRFGYTVLEADAERLTVTFRGTQGQGLYAETLRKGENAADCSR
jgi:hypothetical protein